MQSSLFTYGTLEFPEIMQAITGRLFRAVPGTLENHAAYLLRRRVYPGLRYDLNQTTVGTLYLDIDERSKKILDWFEDNCYQRRPVSVALHNGAMCRTEVYLLAPTHRQLLTKTRWNPTRFREECLVRYRLRCRDYHRQACAELGLTPQEI
ncbi:MAG: gamma-glutamylcyclotransferase family protein [Pseudomonadota bacterium]